MEKARSKSTICPKTVKFRTEVYTCAGCCDVSPGVDISASCVDSCRQGQMLHESTKLQLKPTMVIFLGYFYVTQIFAKLTISCRLDSEKGCAWLIMKRAYLLEGLAGAKPFMAVWVRSTSCSSSSRFVFLTSPDTLGRQLRCTNHISNFLSVLSSSAWPSTTLLIMMPVIKDHQLFVVNGKVLKFQPMSPNAWCSHTQ